MTTWEPDKLKSDILISKNNCDIKLIKSESNCHL